MSHQRSAEKAAVAAACDRGPCWLGKGHDGNCRPGPNHNMSAEQDEVLGTYAPRCSRCGWQDQHRDYTERTKAAQHALALAQVAQHKAECPGIPPESPESCTHLSPESGSSS